MLTSSAPGAQPLAENALMFDMAEYTATILHDNYEICNKSWRVVVMYSLL